MFKIFRSTQVRHPRLVDLGSLNLEMLPGAVFQDLNGFPRVSWHSVSEAIKAHPNQLSHDKHQTWTGLAVQWLLLVCKHLQGTYQIWETEHLLVLTLQEERAAKRLIKFGEEAYDKLETMLARSREDRGFGKHVVLILGPSATYYDYISHFYAPRDRPYGTSSGIYLLKGYRHTVLNGPIHLRTLVHELAHDMVYHRPLPTWVTEGLAQAAEEIVGSGQRLIDARRKRLHRRYWRWFGINRFWTGISFRDQGGQPLSYELANVLFQNLATHRQTGPRLAAFIAQAHRDDAGEAACQNCFQRSLGALVTDFLGDGPWEN